MIFSSEVSSCSSIVFYYQDLFADTFSKKASGPKKLINGDFRSRVFIQERAAQKRFLAGRQVAWMILKVA